MLIAVIICVSVVSSLDPSHFIFSCCDLLSPCPQLMFAVSELVSGSVETIGEEKARKVLDRVDFLSKLREEVAPHPDLKEKLELHAELALDLPEWWIPGKHDHDLVVGAARSVNTIIPSLLRSSTSLKAVVPKINSNQFDQV